MNLYAAYREDLDWVPISSISVNPDDVAVWVNKTYMSNEARKMFRLVKIRIRVIGD